MAREGKTLYLRGMSPEVVKEAKIEAVRRGVTLAGLVEEALGKLLEREAPLPPDLDLEAGWFRANRPRLLEEFEGEYLAIRGQAVADHDADFDKLARRVFERWGPAPVFMPKVTRQERTVRLRTPRVARG